MRELPPNTKTRGDDTLADLGSRSRRRCRRRCRPRREPIRARRHDEKTNDIDCVYIYSQRYEGGKREEGRELKERKEALGILHYLFYDCGKIAARKRNASEMYI